ncbi:EAL domain-containing protein [Sulfurospirillum sp.]|nr:EAL domain-containing protein [Sulfurospirillum sp.]
MEHKTSSRLTKWIVILPLLGIVITAVTLVEIFLGYEKELHDENLQDVRKEIIKNSKISAHDKVLEVADYIKTSKKLLKDESKKEVKTIVNFAIGIVDYEYKNRKDLTKEEVVQRVIERLRDIRFFNNQSGYFFVYDMEGNCLLLPSSSSLENTNLLDLQDAKGTFIIKEHRKIVEESKEGFHEWYWYKSDSKKMKKKIGFVKAYEELGIYIGTARYEEDIHESIKEEIQKLLMDIRYAQRGYIFAYDYSGTTIADINRSMIGINRWDFIIEKEHIIQNFIIGAKTLDKGFFMTYLASIDSKTGDKNYKTSFLKDIPELGWVIGAGAYYNDLLKDITLKRINLKDKLALVVERIGYATLVVLVIMLIITLIVSIKLHNILKKYQKNLIVKHKQTIEQKEQLVYQLEHDHLTELPNRIMLMDRLIQAIKLSKRDKREIAIMFIDVDKFKKINDSMGHDVGDIILKEVASRLKKSIRESDIVARFGGDEFIILVDNYKSIHDLITIIDKIQKAIKVPISLDDSDYKTTLSIGISIFPNDGNDPHVLLKNADIAMYRAKESGRDAYRFFTKHMNEKIQTRIEIENSLQVACEKKEFVLYYQPLIDADINKIVGVEALIRWQHPTRGLIYPDQFISVAEESNLIIDIGKWVIDESFNQIAQWRLKGYDIQRVSINVAPRQLESSDLIDYIQKVLEKTSCKAQWLEIEVVERYIMKNPEKSIKILKNLKDMGIDIAIDDFGTGYSSLAYLKKLPVTKLKIDRAFVKNLDESFEDRAIAKTIIALGNGLLMKVLAEGVETKEQKEFLMAQGCHLMQGYLFSKPISAKEMETLLKKYDFNQK